MELSLKKTFKSAFFLYFEPLIWFKNWIKGLINHFYVLIVGDIAEREETLKRQKDLQREEALRRQKALQREKALVEEKYEDILRKISMEKGHDRSTHFNIKLHFESTIKQSIELKENHSVKDVLNDLGRLIDENVDVGFLYNFILNHFKNFNPMLVYATAIAFKNQKISESILSQKMYIDSVTAKVIITQLYYAGIIGQESSEGIRPVTVANEEELANKLIKLPIFISHTIHTESGSSVINITPRKSE